MNYPQHLLAAGLLASAVFAAGAQTPPAAPGAAPAPRAAREHHGRFDAARMQQYIARRQAELKQKLQITPAQEGAWSAYAAAHQPPADLRRPERGEFDKLTTPERIDRMRAMQAARAAEMDKRAEATQTFYAALSPEQKKVFDAETAPRRHAHGHGHRPA